jgi:paraquat-inducible protein A
VSLPPYAVELNLALCHTCGAACALDAHDCPRCAAAVHRRKPNSLARTWAFLIAGLIFYIPANLMPVMHTNIFGSGSEDTIFSGIMVFWNAGEWDLALVIFIASVAVPCMKFLVLGVLLVTCQRRSRWAQRERAKLYRMVELVGYWSMLDVLVVALIAALVQFRSLSSIDPRMGILFFGLVVVMTMFAAMSFDPRLIWDTEVNDA